MVTTKKLKFTTKPLKQTTKVTKGWPSHPPKSSVPPTSPLAYAVEVACGRKQAHEGFGPKQRSLGLSGKKHRKHQCGERFSGGFYQILPQLVCWVRFLRHSKMDFVGHVSFYQTLLSDFKKTH